MAKEITVEDLLNQQKIIAEMDKSYKEEVLPLKEELAELQNEVKDFVVSSKSQPAATKTPKKTAKRTK